MLYTSLENLLLLVCVFLSPPFSFSLHPLIRPNLTLGLPFLPPPQIPTRCLPSFLNPPHHHGNHHLPLRPTLGGLISTFVSPLPPPLLLLFLSSALRSLSLKMVTPQSLFTLFGMFNLYYSICLSLSVNRVLFSRSSVMSWTH